MKRSGWQWLVASSLLFTSVLAIAETRQHYGGTLHVEMRSAPLSLDPADRSFPHSFGRWNAEALMFDTLVTTDGTERAQPALAESWQLSQEHQHCQLRLRHNVKFHDGTTLTPEVVASSLRFANPSWKVLVSGDSVVIEGESSNLLAELSIERNAIVKRDAPDGKPIGTGPFHVASWEPGKKLVLMAEENHWRGRPYLDGVEIEFGRSFREQTTALQLGKADLIEIAPEEAQRFSQAGRNLAKSAPVEVLALVFARDSASADEKVLREVLAFSIERSSIHDVLLKRTGQPAGGILPTWISGYGFVFSSSADLAKARQLRNQVRTASAWKLAYDGNDPLDRLLAERIALNARDAGLSVQPASSGTSDLRLMRIPLASSDPWTALQDFLNQCGIAQTIGKGNSIGDLYGAEQSALATSRVIPLFHLPVSYASSSAVKDWGLLVNGSWNVSGVWLESTKR